MRGVLNLCLTIPLVLASPVPDHSSPDASPVESLADSPVQKRDDPAPIWTPTEQPANQTNPVPWQGGTLVCQSNVISQPDPNFFMDRDEAATAIKTFCSRISPGVTFQDNGTPFQYAHDDGLWNFPILLSAVWKPEGRTDCPVLSFSLPESTTVCQDALLNSIVDSCNIIKNNMPFWKGGGTFTKDCIEWKIKRAANI